LKQGEDEFAHPFLMFYGLINLKMCKPKSLLSAQERKFAKKLTLADRRQVQRGILGYLWDVGNSAPHGPRSQYFSPSLRELSAFYYTSFAI
jgi:hypothetical protein